MAMHLSLGAKIISGFCVIILMLIILGGVATWQMQSASGRSQRLANEFVPGTNLANALDNAVNEANLQIRTYIYELDPKLYAKAKENLDHVGTALDALEKLVATSPDMASAMESIKKTRTNYQAWSALVEKSHEVVDNYLAHRDLADAMAESLFENGTKYQATILQRLRESIDANKDLDLAPDRITKIKGISDVLNALAEIRVHIKKAIILRHPEAVLDEASKLDALFQRLEEIDRLTINAEQKKQISTLLESGHKYQEAVQLLGGYMQTLTDLGQKRGALMNDIRSTAAALSENCNEQTGSEAGISRDALQASSRNVIIGVVIGFVLSLLLAWFITRSIAGPLRVMIASLTSASEQVSSAAGQVSQSSQRMASGASEQAASLEETTASLQELAASTRQNADNARQADALSQEANRTAMAGEGEANRIAGEVANHLANLTRAVADIKKSTEQTQQVVETIDEIAFQTNLLALNAAVEAARAGEAGMGFAVVADEVRNLAQRSTEEVKNTSELMKQAKTSTERVLEVTATVEQYLKRAVGEAMVGSFKQVVGATEKVTHLMAEVSAASDEQAKGVEQINSAIAEMDRVTQENAASAEESAAASEELNAQADDLMQSVMAMTSLVRGGTASTVMESTPTATPTAKAPPAPVRLERPAAPRASARQTKSGAHPASPGAITQTKRPESILPLTDDEQQSGKSSGDFSHF
jgi:methyl-accepting chemotaxis protein